MNTHKFRKLNVWRRSVKFVTEIYKITSKFPKEEKFGLMDQIRRAAISISLNIAEGSGAGTDAEFNLKMTDTSILEEASSEVDQLSAMISGLIKSLKADS